MTKEIIEDEWPETYEMTDDELEKQRWYDEINRGIDAHKERDFEW